MHFLPAWKELETERQFLFNYDSYYHIRRAQQFRPIFADLETKTLYAVHREMHHIYHKNDYPLVAKFLLKCSRERTNVINYHDLDIRA